MAAAAMYQVEETTKPVVPPPPITQEPPLASVATATPNDVVKPTLHDTTTTPTALTPQKTDPSSKISSKGSLDRDVALAQLENEKRSSFVKAWEESEKSKVDNKAQKKLSAVVRWENTQKAKLEAKLKKLEEQLEHKKAEYAEKIKNKVALIHKEANEKRAMVDARRGKEILKAEEMAAKYRATGKAPKKFLGCF
ncbi:PREDICTED: remorin-like [Nicotiana attenuata]|uniref:remorin-like n=1 Tax=Nicotiana attenuata TaxID=49451 RepID=UPI000904662C|nr:PREDICTED: remorin-like [Nicotiana attenuata]